MINVGSKMKSYLVILAVALVSCHALPQEEDGRPYDNAHVTTYTDLTGLLEKFKAIMKTGNSTLGIPVLEPLVVKQYGVKVNEELIKATVLVTNLRVDNLSEFKAEQADFAIAGLKTELRLKWPQIKLQTEYYIKGTAIQMPVYGDGDITANIKDLEFYTKVNLTMKDGKLIVRAIESAVSLGSLDFKITGLFDDESISKMASQIVSDMAPQLIEEYQKEVTNMANDVIKTKIDEILADMSLGDLIRIITG